MAVITKITTQQKNQDRFNIFMDYGQGEKFAFSVDSDVLIKFQLKKGMELENFALMEIHYQDDIRKAYNLAVSYLARRMRAVKELKDYLMQKDIEEPVIQEVVHKLSMQNYLNDEQFALAYTRTQINTTDKGPELIRMELKEKGINQGIIEISLEEFSFEQRRDKAIKLCEKSLQKGLKESDRAVKQKIEQLLIRKGFTYDVIQYALSEIKDDQDRDELEAVRFQGEKLHRKYSHLTGFEYKQKMKQALYRKGFSIDLIEQFLAKKIEKS
ncbi:MAG: recombination regulator RecX [Bacillota bacterium]|nr:recombination regulator RecX [Bacillota bacterium]